MLSRAKTFLHIVADNKVIFGAFFLFVFASSFVFLYLMNLVPDQLQVQDISSVQAMEQADTTSATRSTAAQMPIKITIEKIGVNAIIQNPTTTNEDTLDSLLTKGAVRYPGSGLPGQGNLYVFGHSTSIKIVNNQAYKTFNGFKNLVKGDLIAVYSSDKKYVYQVDQVLLVNSDDYSINIKSKKTMLTLSTCNTLGAKEQRYVVLASYIGVQPNSDGNDSQTST